ncbi:LuxR C-terminal-related transcriptional regulator [Desulfoplanes sp.]
MSSSSVPTDVLSLELSTVVEDFCDVILYVDQIGSIIATKGPVSTFFKTDQIVGRTVWSVLGFKVKDVHEMLAKYPPEDIQEIFSSHGSESFCLRIIPLPAHFSPQGGFVVVVTSNSPLMDLCDTYEQRLSDNITAWDDSMTLFHALFETTADPTFLVDAKQRMLSANKAAKTLYKNSFSLGKNYLDIIRPVDNGSLQDAMRTLRPGKSWTREMCVREGPSGRLPVELTLRRVDLNATRVYHLVLRDLSELDTLEKGLNKTKAQVEGMNVTLRNVLNSVEEEKQDLREEISKQVKDQILPALDRMAREECPEVREDYYGLLKDRLVSVTHDPADPMDALILTLTPKELEIARLIASGQSSKQIAEFLGSSFDTIQTHRKNIRKKLGIRGKPVSLYAFLNSQGYLGDS